MFDAHKNLAVASIVTAPSPAASGTSLVVGAGQGARFPAVPFNCTIWPVDMAPDPTTAEVVRVTARTTDTLTIVRAQEGTTARTVLAGDLIAATITAKSLDDIESGTNFPLITTGAITGTTGTFSGTVTTPTLAHATAIAFSTAATVRGQIHNSGGFSWGGTVDPGAGNLSAGSGQIVLKNVSGLNQIHLATNDGADTGRLALCGGGGQGDDRGGYVSVFGNEAGGTGKVSLVAGNVTGAVIEFITGATVVRGTMHRSGGFSWGTATDPGAGIVLVGAGGVGAGNTYIAFRPDGIAQFGAAVTTASTAIQFINPNSQVGGIEMTGTSTSYNTTSDARLKTSLGPHTDLDVLRRTIIHDFIWRPDGTLGRGVFAQEAAAVAPFAVSVGGDDRDAGGNLTRPWGVDYSKYVPDLIVGWQDHDATVIELRGDVAVLTARLVALEDRRIVSARSSLMSRVRHFINGLFPAWVTP